MKKFFLRDCGLRLKLLWEYEIVSDHLFVRFFDMVSTAKVKVGIAAKSWNKTCWIMVSLLSTLIVIFPNFSRLYDKKGQTTAVSYPSSMTIHLIPLFSNIEISIPLKVISLIFFIKVTSMLIPSLEYYWPTWLNKLSIFKVLISI